MKIVVSDNIGGIELAPEVLEELIKRCPEWFDSLPAEEVSELLPPGRRQGPYGWFIERDGVVYLMQGCSKELRTNTWLIAQVEERGAAVGPNLRVVDIDVKSDDWLVMESDSGRDILQAGN